jgi:hypothetical protein
MDVDFSISNAPTTVSRRSHNTSIRRIVRLVSSSKLAGQLLTHCRDVGETLTLAFAIPVVSGDPDTEPHVAAQLEEKVLDFSVSPSIDRSLLIGRRWQIACGLFPRQGLPYV